MESNAGLSQRHKKLCAVRQGALTSSKAICIYQVGNFEILNKKNMRYTVSIKRISIIIHNIKCRLFYDDIYLIYIVSIKRNSIIIHSIKCQLFYDDIYLIFFEFLEGAPRQDLPRGRGDGDASTAGTQPALHGLPPGERFGLGADARC